MVIAITLILDGRAAWGIASGLIVREAAFGTPPPC